MSSLSSRLVVVRVALVVAAFAAGAGVAEARPVRGPVARAERRVFRAQMALERELARPLGRVRVIEVPVYPVAPGGVPGALAEGILPPAAPAPAAQAAVTAPAQAAVRPPVPPTAGGAQAGVARTAFEAPLPEPVAAPQPEPEPAADGTVSVLVRPDSQPAGSPPARAAEPLLFPGAAQP